MFYFFGGGGKRQEEDCLAEITCGSSLLPVWIRLQVNYSPSEGNLLSADLTGPIRWKESGWEEVKKEAFLVLTINLFIMFECETFSL